MVPLRTAKLALTGGGERVCRAGPPEEVGRNTKEVGRDSLRFGGLNRGSEDPGSSSFGEPVICEITTFCSQVLVVEALLMEYPEGDEGRAAMAELPAGG